MVRRMGFAVGSRRLRAVLLHGDSIAAVAEQEWTPESLSDAFFDVVRAMGETVPRAHRIVLERDLLQLRVLSPDESRTLRTDPASLFRRNGSPLTTATLASRDRRELLTAAADSHLVDRILESAQQVGIGASHVGISSETVLTSTGAIPSSVTGTWQYALENGHEVVEFRGGRLVGSRLRPGTPDPDIPLLEIRPEVAFAGDRFAGAFGAALRGGRLKLRGPEREQARALKAGRQARNAWLAALATLLLTVASYDQALRRDEQVLVRETADLAARLEVSRTRRAEAVRSERMLSILDSVRSGRTSNLVILDALGEALPEDATVHSLDLLDDGTIKLTAESATAAGIAASVEPMAKVGTVRLAHEGPVVNGRQMVSLLFFPTSQ